MMTRIVQVFCAAKCRDIYVVQKWIAASRENGYLAEAHWEPVKDFELDEYDKACRSAMDLSMTKKPIKEMAVFDNGKALVPSRCHDGDLQGQVVDNCETVSAGVESAPQ